MFVFIQFLKETFAIYKSGQYHRRDIAQLGRVPALGAGCRRFKSYYPDEIILTYSLHIHSITGIEL